jgi:large subunit ribosomal protein L1
LFIPLVGKVSFSTEKLLKMPVNFPDHYKVKPTAAKGTYMKSVYLSSTMSPGIKIDAKAIDE